MSIERIYRCNLCQRGGERGLVGIYWQAGDDVGTSGETVTRYQIKVAGVLTSDHHLCKDCIKDVALIYEENRK